MCILDEVDLQIFFTAVAVLVSIVVFIVQVRQNNRSLGATLLRDFMKEFDVDLRPVRYRLAQYLLERAADSPTVGEVGIILDFFDTLGLYVNKGVLDKEMVWSSFYWWLGPYWQLLKCEIRRVESNVAYYKDLEELYPTLTRFGQRHRNLPDEQVYFSEEKIRRFLVQEIAECGSAEELVIDKDTSS